MIKVLLTQNNNNNNHNLTDMLATILQVSHSRALLKFISVNFYWRLNNSIFFPLLNRFKKSFNLIEPL